MKHQTVTALFEYVGVNQNELDFKEGDVITVLDQYDENWYTGELNGKIGIFPYNYVLPGGVKQENEEVSTNQHSKTELSETQELKIVDQYKALYDYDASDPSELSFKQNDVINLIEAYVGSDWFKGELNGKIGLFAVSWTNPIEKSSKN